VSKDQIDEWRKELGSSRELLQQWNRGEIEFAVPDEVPGRNVREESMRCSIWPGRPGLRTIIFPP
jgi:hypothetical protein